jgi:hypothetical protein
LSKKLDASKIVVLNIKKGDIRNILDFNCFGNIIGSISVTIPSCNHYRQHKTWHGGLNVAGQWGWQP